MRSTQRQAIFTLFASLLIQPVLIGSARAQLARPADIDPPSTETATSSVGVDGSQTQEARLRNTDSANRQRAGYISGTVLDQTGAISVGADVRLSSEGGNPPQETQSGHNGQFLFAEVAPGPFRLTVTAPGFSTLEFSADLRAGEAFLVPPITLSVATAFAEVHVKESPLTPSQVADIQLSEQTKQRVLGLFPNFYVSYEPEAVALTAKQKFRLAGKTASDPFTFVGVAAIAGVEQATDTFEGYGQGAQGYFKRFSATYTDAITATYIGSAILPSILKQDPRYFYKGTGSTGSRILYAVTSPFFCKGDNMRWQPNYSNIGGTFASAGISYLYYPESDRNGAGLVIQNSLIRLGEMSFEGVLQEFVIRKLTPHLKKRASDQR
jgi:carboxypeptidase family protein